MKPRVSVVIPVYNEDEAIVTCLDRIFEAVTIPCEVLVVYDAPDDTTVPYLEKYARIETRLVPTLNEYGRGPARAIRYGIDRASADVVVVTMADGSDDPQQIDQLTRLVERGVVVAAASRYTKGGQQVGGPWFKGFLSRLAGRTLFWFGRVGTRDATNSFKAYSRDFVREVGVESDERAILQPRQRVDLRQGHVGLALQAGELGEHRGRPVQLRAGHPDPGDDLLSLVVGDRVQVP
jgi:dolichol-phosphate mannosyltransferase